MSASTLYRFRIDLNDIDRNVYEILDLRVALHPSETLVYLITRVMAYCINYAPGIEFSKQGLGDPEGPPISISGPNGFQLWIEIGNPSSRKLHKASKSSPEVKVYTHRDPHILLREIPASEIHRAEKIEIFGLPSSFLEPLAEGLLRDVRWNVLIHDGRLTVGDHHFEIERLSLI